MIKYGKKQKKTLWPGTSSPLNLNVKAHIILIKYTLCCYASNLFSGLKFLKYYQHVTGQI